MGVRWWVGRGTWIAVLSVSSAVACTADLGPLTGATGADASGGLAGASSGTDSSEERETGDDGGTEATHDAEKEMPSVAPTTFRCDPDEVGQSPPLRRLSRVQYESSLRDLFTMALNDQDMASELMEGLRGELNKLVDDIRVEGPDSHASYRRLDQAVQQNHVDTWFEVGRRAGELLAEPPYLEALVGSCVEADDESAEQCIDEWIARFGRLALRRPLNQDEHELYRTFYEPSTGIDPAGIVDVVTGLLNAPQFLYLVEHGSEESDVTDNFELGAYELAARLSYHFWNTMPDEELLSLAESGELLDDKVYQSQVERLFADRRTYATVSRFFSEWLGLEDLSELDRNNESKIFSNFAGENLPSKRLRQDMIDEAIALLNFYTWDQPRGLEEIFLSPLSFTQSSELAAIYGVDPWDGESEPPELPEERPGLLTRAAFLATGTANTRPIMKGVFIRTQILCDQIPPPPENANAVPPQLSAELTTREVVEELTENSGGGCAGCHARFINPLGFPTEGFDSLGRARSEQMLFDEQGEVVGSKSVDTEAIPQVVAGDMSVASGPEELMELIVSSGKLEACFARHYFRFSFGRFEGVESDGCVLEEMRRSLAEGGSVADMLRSVALGKAFRQRSFSPSNSDEQKEM